MTSKTIRTTIVAMLTVTLAISAVAASMPNADGMKGGNTIPIEKFVDSQGTLCIGEEPDCFLIVPPIPNFIGQTDPEQKLAMSADYAGLADQWIEDNCGVSLGTTHTGKVIKKQLNDELFEYQVVLNSKNVLTWVTQYEDPNTAFNAPLVFGYRADDICNADTGEYDLTKAALGNTHLNVKFVSDKDLSLEENDFPDFIETFFFTDDVQTSKIISSAQGFLRTDSGDIPGTAHSTQITLDGLNTFIVEKITLR